MAHLPMRSFQISALLLATLAGVSAARAQSTTTPAPVVASSALPVASGFNQPQSVASDSAGNLFVANAGAGTLIEIPAAGGAQITLATGLSYPKGVTADSAGNSYITDYGGNIWRAPAGGAANSAVKFVTGSTCPDFATIGYYVGWDELGADGLGNIYAAANSSYLFKFDAKGDCTELLTPTQLGTKTVGNLAADAAGDVYFSVFTSSGGNNVYAGLDYLAAGSTTPVAVGVTLATVGGLHVDGANNLYIADGSGIAEVPYTKGALVPANLTFLTPSSPPDDFTADATGAIFAPNFNLNTVQRVQIGSLQLGASAVGTAGTAGAISYTFNAAETPTSFSYISGGAPNTEFATTAGAATATNTCAAGTAYVASKSGAVTSCTLNVLLTPALPGKRTAAALLNTAAGTLVTTYLSGTGTGAGLTVSPGTQTAFGTFTTPAAVRVDGAGNVFVADSGANQVLEYPAGGGTATTIGTGLRAPQGLAVAPDGTLFISDTGNNRVVEVPLVNGVLSSAAQTVVASSATTPTLNAPLGLALDLYGNVLVANSGGGTVLRLPNQGGVSGVLPAGTVGSGFTKPTAVAVDSNNDVFVGDATAGKVVEVTPAGVQSSVFTGYAQIAGLALDANNDVFLTQTGVGTVTKVSLVGGAYATNATSTVGSGFTGPQGIALDGPGNLYIADAGGAAAYKVQRTLGLLQFGRVNVGASSATQSLTLANTGNAALTFSTPVATAASGNTGDFTVTASGTNGCAAGLATGASCSESVVFTPTAAGARTEVVNFASNAVNASPVGATLAGTGVNSQPATLSLSVSPQGQINYGQTFTVTATVAPKTASTTPPTGTVQFLLDGNAYGNPIMLATVNGNATASISIGGLAGGTHTINATYSGDGNYASASATSPLSIAINPATTTTTVVASNGTTSVNGSVAVVSGTSVTFTATVASSLPAPPYPSGSVTFYISGNPTTIGSAPLSNGTAMFTTAALPNGQYNVIAVYGGDADFSTSTSSGFAIYISYPSFVVSNAGTSLSVPVQGSGSFSFTLSPIAGYTGTVFLGCTGLPAYALCSFTPAAVDFSVTPGPQNITLTVNTSVPPAQSAGLNAVASVLALLGVLSFALRRRLPRAWGVALLAVGIAFGSTLLNGCGNSTSSITPTGTTAVAVQLTGSGQAPGTAPAITQQFTFQLTVH